MADNGKPNNYEDLLSIAEEAMAVIRVMKASSQGTSNGKFAADKEIDNSNSLGDVFVTNQMSNQLGCVAITKLVVISISYEKALGVRTKAKGRERIRDSKKAFGERTESEKEKNITWSM